MIRIDAIWLAIEPMDMHAGWRESLQRGVPAQPHCAYLFTNKRANRMKVLVHDGHGVWLAHRRLNQGRFRWCAGDGTLELSRTQFDALVLGLPWERLADDGVIRIL